MIGLEKGRVRLAPHDAEWEAEAERTVAELRALLGDAAVDIQHVGSTSVPTIMAKPIIDIAVSAADFSSVLKHESVLRERGYYYRPGAELENQLLFAKGSYYDGSGEMQTHFIHVVGRDSREWRDYINFRDYLIRHPEIAKQYEALKISLWQKAPVDQDREKYLAGKESFITSILAEARAFFGNRR